MALTLTLPIMLRAAGPLLMLLLGIVVMALSRGRREQALVGATLASAGAMVVSTNAVIAGAGMTGIRVAAVVSALAALSAVALGIQLVATTPRPWRWASASMLLAGLATGVVAAIAVLVAPERIGAFRLIAPDLVAGFVDYFAAAQFTLALHAALIGMWALRGLSARETDVRRDAGLAAGLGVTWGFAVGGDAISGAGGATVAVGAPPLQLAIIVVAGLLWALAMVLMGSRTARSVAFALLGATLVGMLRVATSGVGLVFDPYAPQGIARLLGWGIIATAVARAGWLDISFLSRHRTATAATALALLFIVAQVAQNFFSAEFGLLTGGIVAGAFLFAASPLQRAMERVSSGRAEQPRAPMTDVGGARDDAARRESLYLNAARLAMHDRRLTRDEESHLHALAEELGLGAKRAHELLVQAEREAGVT